MIMNKQEFCINLGNRIRKERIKKKLTREMLAHLANINPRALADIEFGLKCPLSFTMYNIACTLDVSIDLLTGKESDENL